MKTLTLIFCLQAMFFMISIRASHSRTFHPNDDVLLEDTCSIAPYYDLCILILTSDPASGNTDVWGFAGIMMKYMKAKANDALAKIHELQRTGTGPKQGLDSCANKYNTIVVDDIPKAEEALRKRDAKISEDALNDVANEATNCETDFPGPLTAQNNATHDVAADTAYIFKLLQS